MLPQVLTPLRSASIDVAAAANRGWRMRERRPAMAVVKSTSSRTSESDGSVQLRGMADAAGSASLFTRLLRRMASAVGRSAATSSSFRFPSPESEPELSDGLEPTRYAHSSVSSGVAQAMQGLRQTTVPGSEAGQEGVAPVNKEREEEFSESPDGESGESAGGKTMGETTLAEVATTVRQQGETLARHGETLARHGETLVRLENKIEEARKEQRGEFRWLLAIMLGGFGALGLVILGAPHVFPPFAPVSVAPQYSPGGYTLTVNPYPTANSPADGAAPIAAPTSASSY